MDWKKIKYFSGSEFVCNCGCGQVDMHLEFLLRLDKARQYAGMPLRVTSGYRCLEHNAEVGGVSSSAHTKGYAADIECKGSRSRAKIVKACIEAGFNRIGIAKDFIHIDSDPDKLEMVYWVY